jgi:streptothricin acetyltransferase
MIEILTLKAISSEEIQRVIGPYTCTETYRVSFADGEESTNFQLELAALDEPWVGCYEHFDEETLQRYCQALAQGFSFGAYDQGVLVGLLIASPQTWNASLWVWEFHVAPAYRGQGIGRSLMEQAADMSVQAGLRTIVCETQNRNAPAIKAYRKLGFQIEGIDISYYTNDDYPERGVAVFMKRRLIK